MRAYAGALIAIHGAIGVPFFVDGMGWFEKTEGHGYSEGCKQTNKGCRNGAARNHNHDQHSSNHHFGRLGQYDHPLGHHPGLCRLHALLLPEHGCILLERFLSRSGEPTMTPEQKKPSTSSETQAQRADRLWAIICDYVQAEQDCTPRKEVGLLPRSPIRAIELQATEAKEQTK